MDEMLAVVKLFAGTFAPQGFMSVVGKRLQSVAIRRCSVCLEPVMVEMAVRPSCFLICVLWMRRVRGVSGKRGSCVPLSVFRVSTLRVTDLLMVSFFCGGRAIFKQCIP